MLTLVVVNSCLQASEIPDTADAADAAGAATATAGDAAMTFVRAANTRVICLYIITI